MALSKGELIIIAAADDISLPSRTERIYGAYIASGCKALSIHSSCMVINSTGDKLGYVPADQGCGESLEAVIENGTHVYGCTHAWHRIVFAKFGPLPTTVKQEDEVIPFRSLILGTILPISEPLVHYRLHRQNASLSYKKRATSSNELQDLYSTQYANRLDNLLCYLIKGDLEPVEASKDYSLTLSRFASPPLDVPRFDLVYLGMGEDGHTASLFPGSPVDVTESTLPVTAHYQNRPANRVTLTQRVFNEAHMIVFMATGEKKAITLSEVLSDRYNPELYPAQRIDPKNGDLIWLVDKDAASGLPRNLITRFCEG